MFGKWKLTADVLSHTTWLYLLLQCHKWGWSKVYRYVWSKLTECKFKSNHTSQSYLTYVNRCNVRIKYATCTQWLHHPSFYVCLLRCKHVSLVPRLHPLWCILYTIFSPLLISQDKIHPKWIYEYMNEWMNERTNKRTYICPCFSVSFPVWEDLLKFDATAWNSYDWSIYYASSKLKANPQRLHGAKHLPSTNWTYGDIGFYSGQTSYLNMMVLKFAKNETMPFFLTKQLTWFMIKKVDIPVTTQTSSPLATL